MARPGFEPTTSRSRSGCSTTEPAGPVKVAVDKFEEPHDDNYLKLSKHVYLLDKKAS